MTKGKNLRLLIGGSSSFIFHLKEFSDTLNNLGVESKLVFDADYYDGFPSRKIRNWIQTRKKFKMNSSQTQYLLIDNGILE